jgi:hypothetical protein
VIITGLDHRGEHALLGCWTGRTHRCMPLIRDARMLLDEVASGGLVVVDCVGVTRGFYDRPLPFAEAAAKGREQIMASEAICAVDIGALRSREPNPVRPMEFQLEPEVIRIYEESRRFAQERGSPLLETAHLLYGILTADGPWTVDVLAEQGPAVLSRIEGAYQLADAQDPAKPTSSYAQCLVDAQSDAWQRGRASVSELDLLIAVLRSSSTSIKRLLPNADDLRRKLMDNYVDSVNLIQ